MTCQTMRKRTLFAAYLLIILTISGSTLWLSLNLGISSDQNTNQSQNLIMAFTRPMSRTTYKSYAKPASIRDFVPKPIELVRPTEALLNQPWTMIPTLDPKVQGANEMSKVTVEHDDKTDMRNTHRSSYPSNTRKVTTRTPEQPDAVSILRQFHFLHLEWLNKGRTPIEHSVPKTRPVDSFADTDSDEKHRNNTYINMNAGEQETYRKDPLELYQRNKKSHENEPTPNHIHVQTSNETLDDLHRHEFNNEHSPTEDKLHNSEAAVYRRFIYNKYYRRIRNRAGINCSMIIYGDEAEIQRAEGIMELGSMHGISTLTYSKITSCNNFKRSRGYIEDPLSDAERNFPIAFSLIVYKDVEQIERLLRAIYRPHNFYCIHLDIKATPLERKALAKMADCFDNVFMTSRSINVTWGEFSVLEAELICMEELLKKPGWRYFINLTGQEFPLRTNRELVAVLAAMNGANVVEVEQIRAKQRYFYRWTKSDKPPPHNIRPIKGAVHVAVVRHFVEFCVHDDRVRDFLAWLKMTTIPDETFFASVNYNVHLEAPGGDTSDDVSARMSTFLRYKLWRQVTKPLETSPGQPYCFGKFVRDVCILGIRDVSRAVASGAFFVNKLHLDYQRLALDCLEEELHESTWREYINDEQLHVHVFKTQRRLEYSIVHVRG